MGSSFKPSDAAVLAHRRSMGRRVRTISALLRLVGRTREAKKLQVGYETFCVVNNSKTDKDLTFSTRALVALEAALAPGDVDDYLLVWRPVTGRTITKSSAAAEQQQHQQQEQQQQIGAAAAAASSHAAAHLAPAGGDLVWRRYLHTQMAGVYRMLFGAAPSQRDKAAGAAAAAAAAGDAGGMCHKLKSCKQCCSKCCKKCCGGNGKRKAAAAKRSLEHDFEFIK
jgi:hypothetical protein